MPRILAGAARLALVLAVLPFLFRPAAAQTPAEFYKGKTISLITSTGVGGTYDVVARLVARYMPRYIPGNPTIIVQNMPGGGNVLATNYMFNLAPKDGTADRHHPQRHAVAAGSRRRRRALRRRPVQLARFDRRAERGHSGLAHGGNQNLEEATERQIILGGTGAGAGIVILPTVMNNLLGTKFKIVTGYRTSEDVNLGLERGEVQARAFGFDSITSQHPDWITEHKVNFLVQSGAKRDKRLADVPLVTELARNDEQRQIFRLFSSAPALGQPYVAPPGLPADRLAVLRKAFSATLSDKDFLADVEKIRFTIDAMSAEEVAEIVHQTTHAPADIVAKAKAAISTPDR